jgi:hypothetical protein
MISLNRGPSKDASCQVSIHLAKWCQRIRFFFKSTNQKQELSVAVTFVIGTELNSNLYRGLSKDASYQISFHLAKRFQRRIFKKIGQSETRIAYGDHVC